MTQGTSDVPSKVVATVLLVWVWLTLLGIPLIDLTGMADGVPSLLQVLGVR